MCDGRCSQPGWWDAALDRREAVARGGMALAAVLLAACGGDSTGPDGGPRPPGEVPSGTFTVNVAEHAALATDGGVALVTGPGSVPVAVVRQGAGYIALSRVCTHQGNIINPDASAGGFLCPGHGARFSLNGTWLGGQPTTNLNRLTTSFNASTGVLTIG